MGKLRENLKVFKPKQCIHSSCQSFVRVLNHNMYKHSRAYGINRPSACIEQFRMVMSEVYKPLAGRVK